MSSEAFIHVIEPFGQIVNAGTFDLSLGKFPSASQMFDRVPNMSL